MDTPIQSKFERIGARVKVNGPGPRTRRAIGRPAPGVPVLIDVRTDANGEFFDVRYRPDVTVEVLDVRPADRHLLLLARDPAATAGDGGAKFKFLCGHDERHWFVAAVPESARARNVQDAKDALKPAAVWRELELHAVRPDHRDRRRNAAFVRQGEWFFLPRPWLRPDDRLVLRNEPIRRGRGKPHLCRFLYRSGGQLVYVCPRYPNGLTEAQYLALPADERDAHRWRQMARNATVYVKGAIRHPDHKTVWLGHWYQVVMNAESSARAMQHVAFLD